MRRALLASIAVLALCATVTSAQAPAVPKGDYGGGTVRKVGTGPFSAGNMVISLQPGGDHVHIEAALGERCDLLRVRTVARLEPDGSFSADGVVRERTGPSRLRSTYKITGTFGASGATGTASAKTKVTRPKHRTRMCKTGAVQWEARQRSTGAIGTPGATPPAARLYGNTSQEINFDVPAAIVLRVSGDGTRLTRAIFSDFFQCGGNRYSHGLGSPPTSLPIAADGTISAVERLSYRFDRRTRAMSQARFKGTFGSTGASGTLSVKVRYLDLKTADVTRCSTGTVKWAASP